MEERGSQRPESVGGATPTSLAPAAPPALGLPKSGGALRALGETFQAGGPTGTGSFRVPIPISPCRGVEPKIALEYDSGKGHGAFGIGWSVSLPDISRRTDKGIPRYADALESDIFVLAGQEELVPELVGGGDTWTRSTSIDGAYRVDAYRPRVEGLFARVERRTHDVTGDTHWRTITADNVTSVFGLSRTARIADPQNPLHVFRWLLEATFDSHGSATLFEYKAEDVVGVDPSDPFEATRIARPPANAYPKRIFYGNRTPLTNRNPAYEDLTAQSWLFQVVFDYGEHTSDLPQEVAPWPVRPDPVSTFRAGFEIRTYRLCQRVLLFHQMPDQLGAADRLVKALELGYDTSPTMTYLTSARGVGYAWNDAETAIATAAYCSILTYDPLSRLIRSDSTAMWENERGFTNETERTAMKRVLLWNIPDELLLIVEYPSGVVYQNQVGGVTCGQAEVQGVLAPLDASAEAVQRIAGCPYTAARDGISAAIADTIDQILAAEPALCFLKVDRTRLDECLEAWVHVHIDSPESEVPMLQGPYFGPVYGFGAVNGVLTWPNSD